MKKDEQKGGSDVAIARREPCAPMPVGSISELAQVGKLFETSGMFGCREPGQGLVVAMTCQMRGIDPLAFRQTYHLIDGTPTMQSHAMLARLRELGGSYKIIERSPDRAAIEMSFGGNKYLSELTWLEAQKQPYVYAKDRKTLKRNWGTEHKRKQMLWVRAISDGVNVVAPEVSAGMYPPEVVQDFEERAATARTVHVEVEPSIAARTPEPDPAPDEPVTGELIPPTQEKLEPPRDPDIDYTVMPAGKFAGKAWSEFSLEQLERALKLKSPKITYYHRKEIMAEIVAKTAEQAGAVPAKKAETK